MGKVHRIWLFSPLILCAAFVLPRHAQAAVNIVGVDPDTASFFNKPTTGLPQIYGGTAGMPLSGNSSTTTTDTCEPAVTDPVYRLKACNRKAITANVVLTIRFTAGQEGLPGIAVSSTGTSSSFIPLVNSSQSLPAGEQHYIQVRWSEICARITTPINLGSGCILQESGVPKSTFSVGVYKSGESKFTESGDVEIIVSYEIGQDDITNQVSTTKNFASNETGLNEFAIRNGDSKVALRNLNGHNIPTGSNLSFRAVRLIWEPMTGEFETAAFDRINAATRTYADLNLSTDANSVINLSPRRVEGFQNDQYYAFKVAMVDMAGNVGYYTDDTMNQDCSFLNETPADRCHIGHPGEVVGVLSSDVNCFIATAAYGSAMAPQVDTFRKFRNHFLLTAKLGRKFVRFYYRHAPKYAKFISENESLRSLARVTLWPVLGYAWLALKIGVLGATALSLLGLISSGLAFRFVSKRATRRSRV